jgi:hypothetical protein
VAPTDKSHRMKRSGVLFARTTLPWLTDPRLDAVYPPRTRLWLYLLIKTREGRKPVRLTNKMAAEIGLDRHAKDRHAKDRHAKDRHAKDRQAKARALTRLKNGRHRQLHVMTFTTPEKGGSWRFPRHGWARGRKPQGDQPLTGAERQMRYRARHTRVAVVPNAGRSIAAIVMSATVNLPNPRAGRTEGGCCPLWRVLSRFWRDKSRGAQETDLFFRPLDFLQ